jgi:hypothetical protein
MSLISNITSIYTSWNIDIIKYYYKLDLVLDISLDNNIILVIRS